LVRACVLSEEEAEVTKEYYSPGSEKTLEEKLFMVADDIQIGGESNFRHMAMLAKKGMLDAKSKRKARALIQRAYKLLAALSDATDGMPELPYDEIWKGT
jgi:hypothetical protein